MADLGLSRIYPVAYPNAYPVSHRVEGGLSRQSAPYVVGLWRDSTTPRALGYPKGRGRDSQRRELVAELVGQALAELVPELVAELVGGGPHGIR